MKITMATSETSRYWFFALLLGIIALSFFILKPYFSGLLIALMLAVVAQPAHKKILARFSGRESVSALLTALLVTAVIIIPLTFLGVQAVRETISAYNRVSDNFSEIVAPVVNFIDPYFPVSELFPNFRENINEYARQAALFVTRNFASILSNALVMTFNFIITLFALYFFLKDKDKLLGVLKQISPFERAHTERILEKLNLSVYSVVIGVIFVGIVQGVFGGIGFLAFGVPHAVFWGAITAIASLIPGFGTALVTIPAALYVFAAHGTLPGIGMLAWGIIIVGGIDNILRPIFMKRYIDIHPFLIFLSILGGLDYFGPLGVLLGPLVLTLFLALFELHPVFSRKAIS